MPLRAGRRDGARAGARGSGPSRGSRRTARRAMPLPVAACLLAPARPHLSADPGSPIPAPPPPPRSEERANDLPRSPRRTPTRPRAGWIALAPQTHRPRSSLGLGSPTIRSALTGRTTTAPGALKRARRCRAPAAEFAREDAQIGTRSGRSGPTGPSYRALVNALLRKSAHRLIPEPLTTTEDAPASGTPPLLAPSPRKFSVSLPIGRAWHRHAVIPPCGTDSATGYSTDRSRSAETNLSRGSRAPDHARRAPTGALDPTPQSGMYML
jgi:hypothetical protein